MTVQASTASGTAPAPAPTTRSGALRFSLYYFTGRADPAPTENPYRFLLETARFGDRHGFHAVWTPERHFHQFGGLFPNPSVLAAALAVATERVQIRAGSVVLPLHHPVRLVEEWSVVDNLSNGRVGISLATGWHRQDFVLRPETYHDRVAVTREGLDCIRRLWAGEGVAFAGVDGREQVVRTLPRPVQPHLPVWVTSGGNEDTFVAAGRMGANLLTALIGLSVPELGRLIARYHEARAAAGHPRDGAEVTLMLHTFLARDEAAVRATVEAPMREYLRNHILQQEDAGPESAVRDEADLERQVTFAFERYMRRASLFGTPDRCGELLDQLAGVGVTEVACLIDFGVGLEDAVRSLELLRNVRDDYGESEA